MEGEDLYVLQGLLLLLLFSGPGKSVFGMVHWLKQELYTKAQTRARRGCINSSGCCGFFALLQLWRHKREFLISDLSAISCEEPPHCIARAVALETVIFLVVPFSWKSPVSNERRRSPAAPVGQVRTPRGAGMRQRGLSGSSKPAGNAPASPSHPPEPLLPANGSSVQFRGASPN